MPSFGRTLSETNKLPAMRVETSGLPPKYHCFTIRVFRLKKKGMVFLANKANSLAHTKWMCKYHIVFTPKFRRKVIYNQVRKDLIEIFQRLCKYKK